ncbi:hypothetical protein DRE_06776 [Drechslerella stenobrocha 248]|uniref:TEL2-interacting protein 1 n=1 Tax=Drechslerella stenobrocha 248 TaxID=1043628 RepID=W7HX87_9PEZI|nr:hypothetical protein DRE_06776 [Drechslerella stenobrocha 248]
MADNIEARRKQAFAELKPKCTAVGQLVLRPKIDNGVSKQLVKALEELLQSLRQISQVEGIINPAFGDYIFFPLSHIFGRQQEFTDRVIELTLQCLGILISKCWHVNIAGELAKQLMIMVTFIIGGPADGSRPSRASEETKMAAAHCLELLFAAVARSSTARGQFELVENAPSLGHSLTVLLDVIPATSYTELQVAAIGAIQYLFTGCISDDDVLASFLPGTASTLCKFLDFRNSSSRKSKSLVKAIETLSDVIRIVLMDVKVTNLPTSDGTAGSFNNDSITTIRTQSWLHATSEQVRMGLTGVFGLRKHRLLNVKKALCKLCQAIARDCSQSLESSLPVTIETLISLSADKEETLSSQAQESITTLASFNETISQVLQKSLHGWVQSLPRVLQANDEDKKSHLLRQIAASFKILSNIGQTSEILLDLFSRNMKDSIVNLSERNTPTINTENVVTSISPASMELIQRGAELEPVYPAIILSGNSQGETSENTSKLLQMLGGTSIGLQLVHEHIREAQVGTDLSKAVSMWMALNILRASQSQPQDDWLTFDATATGPRKASKLTAELYSVALSSLLDTYDTAEAAPQLTCISLEVLAYTAATMAGEFRTELVDALYPVVHLFGSSLSLVQTHAIVTLESIAQACGYASTRDLLVENADYLVNAVSLKLNMFNVQPQAPMVLLMMIKLSGAQMVPFLDDLVVSIFAALENYHGYETLTGSLFAVLQAVVEESAAATDEIRLLTGGGDDATAEPAETKNRLKRKHVMTLDNVLSDLDGLIQRQSKLLTAEEPTNTDDSEVTPHKPWGEPKPPPPGAAQDDEAEDPAPPAESKPDLKPSHTYLMIESIARLSQNFLTAKSPALRLHLLQLIATASPLLSRQEDNFLPLINQLWPVVTARLQDAEPHVVVAALNSITRLCIDCGDFLSSRMQETWPTLRELATKAKKQVDSDQQRRNKALTNLPDDKAIVSGRRSGLAVSDNADVAQQLPVYPHQQGSRTATRTPAAYAPHNQIWSALIPLFEAMADYTHISEDVLDEIVALVAQNLADGDTQYNTLRAALEAVDADVVWLEMLRRSERMRDECGAVPEAVDVDMHIDGAGVQGVQGTQYRRYEFAPVVF